jgi:hypothetical protein
MKTISKSRDAQIVFQSFYCALALIAVVGSVGFFNMTFEGDFYIFFTNISNYLCVVIMFAELIQTIRKKKDGYVTVSPGLRVISLLGIVLTFLVFNILLAGDAGRDPALNYKVECVLLHVVLPIMYTLDWLVFYEHGKMNWKMPLLSSLFPLAYVGYVFAHAALMHFDSSIMNHTGTNPLIYPYFFLNPERVGVQGVIKWVIILLIFFIVLGFIFMLIDHVLGRKKSAELKVALTEE